MQYSSKTCDVVVKNDQYLYVYFKKGTTQEYDELVAIYELLKRESIQLPILYDISRIDGMDYDAMDFSLREWSGFEHMPMAVLFGKDTISEKYAMMILNTQKVRPSLKFFNNIKEAEAWLLTSG